MKIKSMFGFLTAAFIMLGYATVARSASILYEMTYDGSSGDSGTGSFLWDSGTQEMSEFLWEFGSAPVIGISDASLAIDLSGGTLGAALFEVITGDDVHPSVDLDTAELAVLSAGNLFADDLIIFVGGNCIGCSTVASGYLIVDEFGGSIYEGVYSVSSAVVPIPAASWLFGSGLLGLIAVAKRNFRGRSQNHLSY